MCGVLAIVNAVEPISDDLRRSADRMVDVMRQRGPDGRGLLVKDGVLLGHRRLAIRDVDGGQQPMQTNDGRFAITYNGELYNDTELRETLSSRHNIEFKTRCDTETLLHAFSVWGSDCVDRLRGMFAFAAVDFRSGEVVLARDRCGVKPLYYTTVGHSLVAASSIAAILEHPLVGRRPNFRAISHYLSSFRLTLGHETMYENIFQLMPGQRMRLAGGETQLDSYWQLPDENPSINFEEAVASLDRDLDESVERRQVSDRPVGLLLSGGVDSATIAVSMSDYQANFEAIGAGEAEAENASTTAKTVGCEFSSIDPSPEQFEDAWRELLDETRLPCSTPSDPVIVSLARTLKQKVDVALSGEGADELLCGYAAQHWSGEDFDRYGRGQFGSAVEMFLSSSTLVKPELKPAILSLDAWRAADQDAAIGPIYERAAGEDLGEGPSRRLYRMIHRINLEGQLSRLDTASMQASLESRVPFTDHLLCEKMAAVPFDQHIRMRPGADPSHTAPQLAADDALQTKRVLRAVARRRLPEDIAERRKQSFPTPVQQWLTNEWSDGVSRTFSSSSFAQTLIHPDMLPLLCEAPNQAGMLLWPLLNLIQWGDREFAA